MKVLDRLGNEIKVGSKLAWVSKSYGTPLLKIGNVIAIDVKYTETCEEDKYDSNLGRYTKTGRFYKIYRVKVRAEIPNPRDVSKKYIARLPDFTCVFEGEEGICKIDRAEVV